MSDLSSLMSLLALVAAVGLWLKLSAAREQATRLARQQCQQHGLQLLDETVGLRALRIRRVHGLRRIERCYAFEVSIDGDDRNPGRLWMVGSAMSGLSLPTLDVRELHAPAVAARGLDGPTSGNVVPLRPAPRASDRLH